MTTLPSTTLTVEPDWMNIHVAYLREVLAGDPLMLRIRLLEADSKRVMTLMELWQTRDNYLAATMEQLSLHVAKSDDCRAWSEVKRNTTA